MSIVKKQQDRSNRRRINAGCQHTLLVTAPRLLEAVLFIYMGTTLLSALVANGMAVECLRAVVDRHMEKLDLGHNVRLELLVCAIVAMRRP